MTRICRFPFLLGFLASLFFQGSPVLGQGSASGRISWIDGNPTMATRNRSGRAVSSFKVGPGDSFHAENGEQLRVDMDAGTHFILGEGTVTIDVNSTGKMTLLSTRDARLLVTGTPTVPVWVQVLDGSGRVLAVLATWGTALVWASPHLDSVELTGVSGRSQITPLQGRTEGLGPRKMVTVFTSGQIRRTAMDSATQGTIQEMQLSPMQRRQQRGRQVARGGGSSTRHPPTPSFGGSVPGFGNSGVSGRASGARRRPSTPAVGPWPVTPSGGRPSGGSSGSSSRSGGGSNRADSIFLNQIVPDFKKSRDGVTHSANSTGGWIQFGVDYGSCTGRYRYQWEFSKDLRMLSPGEEFHVTISCFDCMDICKKKWVYAQPMAGTLSKRVQSMPGYSYNQNIRFPKGYKSPGGVLIYKPNQRKKSYRMVYDPKKNVPLTAFSLSFYKHMVVYVFAKGQGGMLIKR